MDTSEIYIKMSEQATDIQELADAYNDQFSVGAWYSPDHVSCKGHFEDWHTGYKYCPVFRKPLTVTPEFSICRYMNGDDSIWLPRQDQLQILSGLGWYLFDKTCVTWATVNPEYQRESKEIAGLQVVMHTLHSEKWNGSDWVPKD